MPLHRLGLRAIASVIVLAVVIAQERSASAQNKPFPHSGTYAAGFVASNISAEDVHAVYTKWKSGYLKTDCGNGMIRVEFSTPGQTVSEGMGYGMLLTAYFGDKTEFDGLWKFAQKNFNANHVMGWEVTCSGPVSSAGGGASATDGDGDMALALVAAIDQWGEAYRQPALDLLKAMKAKDFATCAKSGRAMATNGDWDKGCTASNSSYWMPGYYRVFEELTGDAYWGKVADDSEALWIASRNATTGLSGNEVNEDGTTPSGQANVNYNGCRTPWRAAVDYIWYGNSTAKDVDDKITTWADGKGLTALVDGYSTSGAPTGGWNGSDCFNGGYATGAMTNSQARVDKFSTYFKSLSVDNYYETSLRALYMLTLSGNFWKPGSPATSPPPVSDDGGAAPPATNDDGGVASGDAGVVRPGGGTHASADGGVAINADASGDASGGCACNVRGARGGVEDAEGTMGIAALLALAFVKRRRTHAR